MKQNIQQQSAVIFGTVLSVALIALAAAGQKPVVPAPVPAAASTLFESKIRPMLLTSCVGCHGKDSPAGNLRLDVAVTPEKAQTMLQRVRGEGGKQRMPIGPPLSHEKIALLEVWVKSGAIWGSNKVSPDSTLAAVLARGKNHWAFQPLVRPAVPKIAAASPVRNPIDAFVMQRLQAKGLTLNPLASRRELIRRVTYDLTGLPPTPEEISAFEADKFPAAYDRLVDRLLASPHYGEKWGRHWLDLIRYAETNSYERDNPKPNIYKYRDYVIRAFNSDKPYNRFIQEQIAGDELPDANGETFTATAYYRLGIWDDEPADMKQAAADEADDLVATTGQAFLGLTFDCARCHDHKFDPIPQKDYYRLVSFFCNINRFKNGGPTDETTYFATAEEKRTYDSQIAEYEAKSKVNAAALSEIQAAYKAKRPALLHSGDVSDLHYRYYEGGYDAIPAFDTLKASAAGTLPSGLLELTFRKRDESFGAVFEGVLHVPKAGGYTFTLDSDDGSRLTIDGKKLLEKNAGGGQGMPMRGTIYLEAGTIPFRVDYFQGTGPFGLNLSWSGPDFLYHALTPLENCSALGLLALQAAEIPALLGAEKAAEYTRLTTERAALDRQMPPPAPKVLCVTEAGPHAPATFVLLRGNPQTPGDKVEPAFPLCAGGGPLVLPAPPAGARTSGRRLALANWIASPDNPLTARVIVNRIWQHHFGRGLVRTPNDFGLQGARPTHPELLNYLAKEFIAQGWSFKKLHRLILTSNYLQTIVPCQPDRAGKRPAERPFLAVRYAPPGRRRNPGQPSRRCRQSQPDAVRPARIPGNPEGNPCGAVGSGRGLGDRQNETRRPEPPQHLYSRQAFADLSAAGRFRSAGNRQAECRPVRFHAAHAGPQSDEQCFAESAGRSACRPRPQGHRRKRHRQSRFHPPPAVARHSADARRAGNHRMPVPAGETGKARRQIGAGADLPLPDGPEPERIFVSGLRGRIHECHEFSRKNSNRRDTEK